jgi:hypothetical protein
LLQFAVCGGHVRSVQAPGSAPAWTSLRHVSPALGQLSAGCERGGTQSWSSAWPFSRFNCSFSLPHHHNTPCAAAAKVVAAAPVVVSACPAIGQVRRASALGLRAVAVSVWLSERGLCEVATVCGLWRPCSFSASAWFGASLASLRHVSPALGQLSAGCERGGTQSWSSAWQVQSVQLQFFSPAPPQHPLCSRRQGCRCGASCCFSLSCHRTSSTRQCPRSARRSSVSLAL